MDIMVAVAATVTMGKMVMVTTGIATMGRETSACSLLHSQRFNKRAQMPVMALGKRKTYLNWLLMTMRITPRMKITTKMEMKTMTRSMPTGSTMEEHKSRVLVG